MQDISMPMPTAVADAPNFPALAAIVMYKPDGYRRPCSSEEVGRLAEGWRSVLRWLTGTDPDVVPKSDLVGEVARKTALRTPRSPEYDVRLWATLAATLPGLPSLPEGASMLDEILPHLLSSLGLERTGNLTGILTEPMIDVMYHDANNFQRNRGLLIPLMTKGPVMIELWTGPTTLLALPLKFTVRGALAASRLSNMFHVEVGTQEEATGDFGRLIELSGRSS